MSVIKSGDIVKLQFDPTDRKEMQGDFRPALVVTPKAFNTISPTWVVAITPNGILAHHEGLCRVLNVNRPRNIEGHLV